MKSILLTRGKSAIVDDDDYGMLSTIRWTAHSQGYAYCRHSVGDKTKCVYMHRLVVKAKKGEIVDHINRDRLDNRKCNLRIVTHIQNTLNTGVSSTSKSGYKGVCKWWVKKKNGEELSTPWRAYYKDGKKQIQIGSFKTAKEAAIAYDKAIVKERGIFAVTNFPTCK